MGVHFCNPSTGVGQTQGNPMWLAACKYSRVGVIWVQYRCDLGSARTTVSDHKAERLLGGSVGEDLATKPEDLCLILGTHMAEEEN